MSADIERGVKWFRPMSVELRLVVTTYEQASELASRLGDMGFTEEADVLRKAIAREEAAMKAHKVYGYIYDPEEKYKEGYLE